MKSLHSVAKRYSKVFIFIDALDECQTDQRNIFLSELLAFNESSKVNIFATSREIYRQMKKFPKYNEGTIKAADEDIMIYLHQEKNKFNENTVDNELLSQIESTVVRMANGM